MRILSLAICTAGSIVVVVIVTRFVDVLLVYIVYWFYVSQISLFYLLAMDVWT